MRHELQWITDRAVYGSPVWLCRCGHRSWSAADHREHVEGQP